MLDKNNAEVTISFRLIFQFQHPYNVNAKLIEFLYQSLGSLLMIFFFFLFFFFFFFFKKLGFDISCKFSPGENLHEISEPIF